MFSSWKTPTSSKRQQELQWIGIINSTHDQICHCDDPTLHLLYCINKFSGIQKPEIDINNIKCLLIGSPTTSKETSTTIDDAGLEEGELENLFAEDIGQQKENENPNTR